MNTTPDDLLAGETVILSKNANAIISVDEQGLSRFATLHFTEYADDLLFVLFGS
jgi:hypothetical protein